MNVKFYVWALLCLYLCLSVPHLKAQELKVGDTLPADLWSLPLNVISHPSGKETMTLNEYKGKLIILDFWATWCSPCVAMLPRMDSLQKEFGERLQIIPLTYQGRKEVSEFMDKYTRRTGREIALPKVIEEMGLHGVFPHMVIPHYVWIAPSGKVLAITGHEEITAEKVREVISRGEVRLAAKQDHTPVPYDPARPFLVDGNGGNGRNMVYQSVLTSYTPGLKGGYSIGVDPEGNGSLSLFNVPLYWYYRVAYGADSVWFGRNRIEINMKEPQRILYTDSSGTLEEWREKYAYCYHLKLPHTRRAVLLHTLGQDLARMFPDIEVSLEKRKKLCWVLSKGSKYTDSPADPRGTGKPDGAYYLRNSFLRGFIVDMNVFMLQNSPTPLLDETGITGRISLRINAKLTDLPRVAEELQGYGLHLRKEYRDINVLVFNDKKRN